jgi:hypothetical protein
LCDVENVCRIAFVRLLYDLLFLQTKI